MGKIATKALLITMAVGMVMLVSQCKPDEKAEPGWPGDDPYTLTLPNGFFTPPTNLNNPLTVNGVLLGRMLFYDSALSGNNTQACASCHKQEYSFTDAPNKFSTGIDGMVGDKNSMAIINMAWNKDFFWDGRKNSLELQALDPVRNPIEMHENWTNAVAKLQAKSQYPPMFKKAFGTDRVDSMLAARALSQFMRSIVATGSKFQKSMPSLVGLTNDEKAGFGIFMAPDKGDCFHCHPTAGLLMTDNFVDNPVQRFHNNGLDWEPAAGTLTGRAKVTGNPADNGKFKAPTLLNVQLTAPYMHDGRFATLEEVVEFYNSGVKMSPTLDVNMNIKADSGPRRFENGVRKLGLTELEKKQLVAFLKTLTDLSVTTNPAYAKP
ncbi:MAG: cytochrome-c peroxidase [Bacteroidota bacterium]